MLESALAAGAYDEGAALAVRIAALLRDGGHLDDALDYLARADQPDYDSSSGGSSLWRGQIDEQRALILSAQGSLAAAVRLLDEAPYGSGSLVRARVLLIGDDLASAAQAAETDAVAGRTEHDPLRVGDAASVRAAIAARAGDLGAAREWAVTAAAAYEELLPGAPGAASRAVKQWCLLVQLALLDGALGQAESAAHAALDVAGRYPGAVTDGYATMAATAVMTAYVSAGFAVPPEFARTASVDALDDRVRDLENSERASDALRAADVAADLAVALTSSDAAERLDRAGWRWFEADHVRRWADRQVAAASLGLDTDAAASARRLKRKLSTACGTRATAAVRSLLASAADAAERAADSPPAPSQLAVDADGTTATWWARPPGPAGTVTFAARGFELVLDAADGEVVRLVETLDPARFRRSAGSGWAEMLGIDAVDASREVVSLPYDHPVHEPLRRLTGALLLEEDALARDDPVDLAVAASLLAAAAVDAVGPFLLEGERVSLLDMATLRVADALTRRPAGDEVRRFLSVARAGVGPAERLGRTVSSRVVRELERALVATGLSDLHEPGALEEELANFVEDSGLAYLSRSQVAQTRLSAHSAPIQVAGLGQAESLARRAALAATDGWADADTLWSAAADAYEVHDRAAAVLCRWYGLADDQRHHAGAAGWPLFHLRRLRSRGVGDRVAIGWGAMRGRTSGP